jgi:hypothetical protein
VLVSQQYIPRSIVTLANLFFLYVRFLCCFSLQYASLLYVIFLLIGSAFLFVPPALWALFPRVPPSLRQGAPCFFFPSLESIFGEGKENSRVKALPLIAFIYLNENKGALQFSLTLQIAP